MKAQRTGRRLRRSTPERSVISESWRAHKAALVEGFYRGKDLIYAARVRA